MAKALQVLIVDDERAIRRLVRTILESQGYAVSEAPDGNTALQAALISPTADLLLLDLGLPDRDGLDIIQELRAAGSTLPIIVLSNRSDESTKVTALDLGADDYLTKPFGARELFARLRTAMRHRMQSNGERPVFRTNGLTIDFVRRVVTLAGEEVKLSPKEYALLTLFAKNAGKVLTHSHILNEIWSSEADAQHIRTYIRSLRQKLKEGPGESRYIVTDQGVGYRLRDTNEQELG
jgi:two-component system, OmpR family, KDP operon response regulator KdpE